MNTESTQSGIVTELTPELADKIFRSIRKKRYDDEVSKAHVLHHLKQIKAQMGKLKARDNIHKYTFDAISMCMEIIDKKISKVNK